MLQKLIMTDRKFERWKTWDTILFSLLFSLCFPHPSEGSWRRRRRGSWVWSGQRDQTEGRTWRGREGPFSCKCVRWGISASQNTQAPFTNLKWWFRSHGWSACGFHISSFIHGRLDVLCQSLLCLSSNSYDGKKMAWKVMHDLIGFVLQLQ